MNLQCEKEIKEKSANESKLDESEVKIYKKLFLKFLILERNTNDWKC